MSRTTKSSSSRRRVSRDILTVGDSGSSNPNWRIVGHSPSSSKSVKPIIPPSSPSSNNTNWRNHSGSRTIISSQNTVASIEKPSIGIKHWYTYKKVSITNNIFKFTILENIQKKKKNKT